MHIYKVVILNTHYQIPFDILSSSIYYIIYSLLYIYISEHKQNVDNDGNRAQPLNGF